MNNTRIWVIRIVTLLVAVMLGVRLYKLQIVNGSAYLEASNSRSTAAVAQKAPRGDIKDRNGKNLVTNREGYSLLWVKTAAKDSEINTMLAKLVHILRAADYELTDTLPITYEPFEFDFTDENGNGTADDERAEWFEKKKRLKSDMTAAEVMEIYREVFKIDNEMPDEIARAVIGIRYDAEMNGFSFSTPYTVATDVDIEIVTKVKERRNEFPDIEVTSDYFRQYEFGSLAAHTLGRIGRIDKEEYAQLRDKGYGYNSLVGKQGIEKICEEDLRGTDGRKILNAQEDGEILGLGNKQAVAGNYVVTTIDSELQMTAEESLKKTINDIAAKGAGAGLQKGGDADAGAAVVIDVRNGEVLTLATYPSYNPETYNEMYTELIGDKRKPLWNRALSGTYSPGSTFKPLTAIAALETGAVSASEKLLCSGVYKYYKDYQPKCWIYLEHRLTHGWENVTDAIEDSCNLYFFEAGRRTGIEALDKYAAMFGLGEYTGIELAEEKGAMASPEYKKKIEGDTLEWYGGDTLQAAIGQSYSNFTPIQLANYIAAIANGGTRYRPRIIKSINRPDDGSEVSATKAVVEERISINAEHLAAVRKGMYGVVDEGSASKIFQNYPISVGGKTGTAQGSSKASNTALFVAFAPYENPEIAVAVVIEHGVRGVNAANVAKDIFDEYFSTEKNDIVSYGIGELLP